MTTREKRNKDLETVKNMIITSIESDYNNGRHLEKGYNAGIETGRIHSDFYINNGVFLQHHVSMLNNILKMEFLNVGEIDGIIEIDLNKLESDYTIKTRDERLGKVLDNEV
ncbi:MAG: hypothetical protein SLAVMIC_00998 [uncultured marine phage]|uniref:Uncharacterized protein n=1 Tax=uncultured marine phage TaxID=707152 RepID=A0A8D9CCH2_9VIRU|nr:MAG: hypothetical protein SLAVMIC_00998 [uncultured marine phage]